MSELPTLYRTQYDVDTLPKKVAEELRDKSRGSDGGDAGEVVYLWLFFFFFFFFLQRYPLHGRYIENDTCYNPYRMAHQPEWSHISPRAEGPEV